MICLYVSYAVRKRNCWKISEQTAAIVYLYDTFSEYMTDMHLAKKNLMQCRWRNNAKML